MDASFDDVDFLETIIEAAIRFIGDSRDVELLRDADCCAFKSSADFSFRRLGSVAYFSIVEFLLSITMFPIFVLKVRLSEATIEFREDFGVIVPELPLEPPTEGHLPSSVVGVVNGVRPLDKLGVLDKLVDRGVDTWSFMLIGKQSGFGGLLLFKLLLDIELVMELLGVSLLKLFLSLDLARSRVVRFGATDFDGNVFDLLTEGGLERGLLPDAESTVNFFGDRLDVDGSLTATFFFPVEFCLRTVGPPVIEEDSLPPSLAVR